MDLYVGYLHADEESSMGFNTAIFYDIENLLFLLQMIFMWSRLGLSRIRSEELTWAQRSRASLQG